MDISDNFCCEAACILLPRPLWGVRNGGAETESCNWFGYFVEPFPHLLLSLGYHRCRNSCLARIENAPPTNKRSDKRVAAPRGTVFRTFFSPIYDQASPFGELMFTERK